MFKEQLIDAIIESDNIKVSNLLDRMDVSAVNEMSEKRGKTALHAACGHRNDPALLLLLAKSGIDVNAQDTLGSTPLHIAFLADNDQAVVRLLATPGIEVNVKDEHRRTPLHLACHADNDQAVARLLATPGIEVNVKDKHGSTPLHHACWKDNDQAVARLLATPGIEVNVKDKHGSTPLHHACWKGNDQAVARLLATPGIEVNVKDISGQTPVMSAARFRREETFKLLLHDHRIDLDFGINEERFLEKMVDLPGSSEENQKYVNLIQEERRKREDVCKKKDEESTGVVIEKIEKLNVMESPPTGEKAKVNDYQMDTTNSPKSQKSEDEIKENPRSSTDSIVDDYTGICWSCSKTKLEVKLYKCSGCKRARYCSRECIEHDWPVHKNWCLKQQEKRESKFSDRQH